ncbi:g10760 [Coccomyxa viridis]|uniref:G10760 protein n=1 Tax=Coccomyxa viridis TaxID=1274662 RepID=A0ABP1G648_9CHLO
MNEQKETEEQGGGLFGALTGAWNYAASSISSFLGYEDLDVVNPDGSRPEEAKADTSDKRQIAFTNYKDYIGMDITSLVTLPVWIMEPYTILQKVAEIMEYTDALDRAAATEDPYERLAWVAGFCIGPFGGNERTWKPFNPILGETFELDLPTNGVRFLAEQVSHHPPISAAHAENDKWVYDIVSAPSTKFMGNSVEIYPVGRSRIKLRKTGEVFSLVPPNSTAHNVIVGSTWVDCHGNFSLTNVSTGAKCSLYFTPCGWFSDGRYQVSGHIYTEEGKKVLALAGAWNSHLDMQPCDEDGDPLPGSKTTRLWQCKEKPKGDKYGFTHFARMLNAGKGVAPLASDSRRRPDRAALEWGDTGSAGTEKHSLEERQRAERKERDRRKEKWAPRWFQPSKDTQTHEDEYSLEDCPMWDFTGDYLKLPRKAADPAEDCAGRDFAPWSYPELHTDKQ